VIRHTRIPHLLGTSQLMEILGVSRQSIMRYVRLYGLTPEIKNRRFWIFTDTEVKRFMRETWPFLHPGPGRKGNRRG
jgi:hypothetical protein